MDLSGDTSCHPGEAEIGCRALSNAHTLDRLPAAALFNLYGFGSPGELEEFSYREQEWDGHIHIPAFPRPRASERGDFQGIRRLGNYPYPGASV